MKATVNILRDSEGNPTIIELDRFGRKATVTYNPDIGFVFEGPKAAVPKLADLLYLIYPEKKRVSLEIPEPLSVVNVGGGKTILFDDLEALLKWTQTSGTVAVDNTNAYNGSQCLKITCGAALAQAEATKYFPFPIAPKNSFQCTFAVNDTSKLNKLRFQLNKQHHNVTEYGRLSYDCDNKYWQYTSKSDDKQITGSETVAQLETLDGVGGAWFKVKFTLDFLSKTYVSAELNGKKFDLNDITLQTGTGAFDRACYARITVDNKAGQEVIGYFDDIIIREEI